MKHLRLILATILLSVALWTVVPESSLAAPNLGAQQLQTLQTLEETLFTVRYDQEPVDSRLARLEETVFGQTQGNLTAEARISKLREALAANPLGPLTAAAKPRPDVVNKASQSPTPAMTSPATHPSSVTQPLPGETDYPAVGQMETKLFGKVFTGEDITARLSRLEKQVFRIEQKGALADRVDNLCLMVLGDTGAPAGYPAANASASNNPAMAYNNINRMQQQSRSGQPVYTQIPNGQQVYQPPPGTPAYGTEDSSLAYSQPPAGANPAAPYYNNGGQPVNADMQAAMEEVEKEVLGHTYPAEPFPARLDRVEMKIFKSTSPEMSPDDRMQRIIAVASAGGAPQSPRARAKSTFQSLLPVILTILPMILL